MTLDDFDKGMARLERMFNRGVLLGSDMRLEYLHALRFLEAPAFEAAITIVIETFKPFPSEPFPAPITIQDAVTMATADDKIYGEGRDRGVQFCQKCRNLGLYIGENKRTHFCRCEKGRERQAAWAVDSGARKRQERIQDELDKLPPAAEPVRGLMEKNALGFWEPTKAEHDRWCAAKRKEIDEIKQRCEEFEKKRRVEKKLVPAGSLKRILDETLTQVEEKMDQGSTIAATKAPAEARAGERAECEEEEDEIPF